MNPRNRHRLGLILVVLLFAAPLVLAMVLRAIDWQPARTRNYGELVQPPVDLRSSRLTLADGSALDWTHSDRPWTLLALPASPCTRACLERLDELRRARLTLNQNAYRLRLAVVDAALSNEALTALHPVVALHDAETRLAPYRATRADDVTAVLIDPAGFLVLRYPADYDANKLRKDLARLIKG